MAGLPRALGPEVTDRIMRLAVGYPRDRLRDIVNAVERIENNEVIEAYNVVTGQMFLQEAGPLDESVLDALHSHLESTLIAMANNLSTSTFEYLRSYAYRSSGSVQKLFQPLVESGTNDTWPQVLPQHPEYGLQLLRCIGHWKLWSVLFEIDKSFINFI